MSTDGFSEPQTMSWKPGAPGDAIKGIFTGNIKEFEGQYGKTNIYEIIGIEGSWTVCDEDGKPTDIKGTVLKGERYGIFERRTFADKISQAKPGQQLIVTYTELRKPKSGGKPYKDVKVLLGPMDEAYLAEMAGGGSKDEVPFV